MFVSVIVFVTTSALPGDAATAVVQGGISQARVDAIRASLHLGDPLPIRYLHWLSNVLQGDLGKSWITQQSVWGLIAESLPKTFELLLAAVLLSCASALLIGIVAALHEGTLVDRSIMTLTLLGVSIPGFWCFRR
jgi:peptide/nickel transport system permease protein